MAECAALSALRSTIFPSFSSYRRRPVSTAGWIPAFAGMTRGVVRQRGSIAQKKLAEPEGSAKFEQGGFTSRRRKDPKTLFPGASPGNLFGAFRPQKLSAIEYRAGRNIAVCATHHQREFGLARLQKPPCFRGDAKAPRK